MEKNQNQIDFNFLGQKVVLKTEGDPALVKDVVALAKLMLKDAERRSKNVAPHQVALLALMDLAEEYVKARARLAEYKQEMNAISVEVMGLLAEASVPSGDDEEGAGSA